LVFPNLFWNPLEILFFVHENSLAFVDVNNFFNLVGTTLGKTNLCLFNAWMFKQMKINKLLPEVLK